MDRKVKSDGRVMRFQCRLSRAEEGALRLVAYKKCMTPSEVFREWIELELELFQSEIHDMNRVWDLELQDPASFKQDEEVKSG